MAEGIVISDLRTTLRQAAADAEAYFLELRRQVAAKVAPGGKVDRKKIDEEQRATHGLAWVLTYVETLKETANWADRIAEEGKFGEIEQLLTQILFGEYLFQLGGGLPMTQLEIVRPNDMLTDASAAQKLATPAIIKLITHGNTAAARMAAAKIIRGFHESRRPPSNTPASTKRSRRSATSSAPSARKWSSPTPTNGTSRTNLSPTRS